MAFGKRRIVEGEDYVPKKHFKKNISTKKVNFSQTISVQEYELSSEEREDKRKHYQEILKLKKSRKLHKLKIESMYVFLLTFLLIFALVF